jgi:hypothetical protein
MLPPTAAPNRAPVTGEATNEPTLAPTAAPLAAPASAPITAFFAAPVNPAFRAFALPASWIASLAGIGMIL